MNPRAVLTILLCTFATLAAAAPPAVAVLPLEPKGTTLTGRYET